MCRRSSHCFHLTFYFTILYFNWLYVKISKILWSGDDRTRNQKTFLIWLAYYVSATRWIWPRKKCQLAQLAQSSVNPQYWKTTTKRSPWSSRDSRSDYKHIITWQKRASERLAHLRSVEQCQARNMKRWAAGYVADIWLKYIIHRVSIFGKKRALHAGFFFLYFFFFELICSAKK